MDHTIDCPEPLVDGILLLIRDNEDDSRASAFPSLIHRHFWNRLKDHYLPLAAHHLFQAVSVRQGGQ